MYNVYIYNEFVQTTFFITYIMHINNKEGKDMKIKLIFVQQHTTRQRS